MKPHVGRERGTTTRIMAALRARGCYVEKILGHAGQSRMLDMVGCYRGLFFSIEVKRSEREHTSAFQDYIIEQIGNSEGFGVRLETVEQATKLLDDMDVMLDAIGWGKRAKVDTRTDS